ALRPQRQEGAARRGVRSQAELEVLPDEEASAVAEIDVLDVDAQPFAEEATEDLRVPALRRRPAALLPDVLRQAGAVQVVLAPGHQRGEKAGEALGIKVVLGEEDAKILSGQRPRGRGAEEPAVPELVLRLRDVKVLDHGVEGLRRGAAAPPHLF